MVLKFKNKKRTMRFYLNLKIEPLHYLYLNLRLKHLLGIEAKHDMQTSE